MSLLKEKKRLALLRLIDLLVVFQNLTEAKVVTLIDWVNVLGIDEEEAFA